MRKIYGLSMLLFLAAPTAVMAQDYEYHPIISDAFTADLGVMQSSNSFTLSADIPGGELNGRDIDFNKAFNVDNSDTYFNGRLRWKFGHEGKWSVWGQYFSNNATGKATLDHDVDWLGITFREGTYAEAGVKLAVTRVLFGRSLFKDAQNDFGFGIGIHNLDLDAYIEGEVDINEGSTGVRKLNAGASQILPNIGSWYNYSPSKRWLLHGRVDWISANINDYDGGLWNASAGVNFQAWRHVGIDLSWQYFNLFLDVSKNDWVGEVYMTYSGPVASVTFAW